MTSELISFRLSGAELEALRSLRKPVESLNLVAQRLIRESLSELTETSKVYTDVNKAVDTTVDKVVDKVVNSQHFEEVLEDKMSSLVNSLNQKIVEYEERLELVEKN